LDDSLKVNKDVLQKTVLKKTDVTYLYKNIKVVASIHNKFTQHPAKLTAFPVGDGEHYVVVSKIIGTTGKPVEDVVHDLENNTTNVTIRNETFIEVGKTPEGKVIYESKEPILRISTKEGYGKRKRKCRKII
jgi:hypothetical protein